MNFQTTILIGCFLLTGCANQYGDWEAMKLTLFPNDIYVKVIKTPDEIPKVILWVSKEVYPDYTLQILP